MKQIDPYVEKVLSMGFKVVPKYFCHGQPVYRKNRFFISRDIGTNGKPHKNGIWKGATSPERLGKKETRSGTYDKNLNLIGD